MAVLITGGSGYLGRSVVQALGGRGEGLVLLLRPGADPGPLPAGARVERGDVTDLDDVATALRGCSAVVHLAARITMWTRDREGVRAVNVGGIRNVVRAASYAAVDRIVYTSTVLALGPTDGGPPGDEEREAANPVPANAYMATKAEALAWARDQASQGAPIVFLYPGIVYGPGPAREAGIMNAMLADLLGGRLPALVGPGDRRWCHAFVPDVARGHALALERGSPGRGYILGGENATLADWVGRAARVAGVRPPRLRIPYGAAKLLAALEVARARATGKPPRLTPDAVEVFRHEWAFSSARAGAELGYGVTPLERGLEESVARLRAGAA